METATLLQHLTDDGDRLAAALAAADLDAPVPGLDWTVGEVAAHLGGVHRWCADLVRERRSAPAHRGEDFVPGPDDDLRAWSAAGHAELVEVLHAAPDDVAVWGFGRSVPARAFWSRRQAHETAVHRADVEAGAGRPVTAVPADVAQDGLREITGFARGFRVPPSPSRLALLAEDGDDWLIGFAGGSVTAARGVEPTGAEVAEADTTVRGTSSDLYLWAWNRPSGVAVGGDPTAVTLWREVRIR